MQYARPQNYVDKCWEWTVGRILISSAEAYADISSLGEILNTGSSRKIVECMKAFKEHFPNSDERLLYGTDWSMIAQEERFPKLFSSKPFPDLMILFLRAVGYNDAQIEGIMFRNAVHFLGLGKAELDKFGEKSTRGRLEKVLCCSRLIHRLDEGLRLICPCRLLMPSGRCHSDALGGRPVRRDSTLE